MCHSIHITYCKVLGSPMGIRNISIILIICPCWNPWNPFLSFFFFGLFLRLHPWHMEVPMLGCKSELQPLAYTTVTKCHIWATSMTCARSLTHWARPGIEPLSSWYPSGSLPLSHDGNSWNLFLSHTWCSMDMILSSPCSMDPLWLFSFLSYAWLWPYQPSVSIELPLISVFESEK